jgi:hypothetical protein
LSAYSFLAPESWYPLPKSFDYGEYIETERELWALFPETQGKRVNFCQLGLTAQIFVESEREGELQRDETFFLMPCTDASMRPVRMKSVRHVTLSEFRMSHITAMRLAERMTEARRVMQTVHYQILGPEILDGEN